MRVKVGDTVYDAKDQPVMVILSDEDKANITDMAPDATKYCAFPEDMDQEQAVAFMVTEDVVTK